MRVASWMVALLALTVPAGVAAHSYSFGTIAIGHLWSPPPAPGADGIPVYGPLLNRGKAAERLVAATTPVAKSVRFRIDKDGKTSWPTAVDLAPGKPLGLAPWRVHLWLGGLTRPLREGDSFDLELTFAKAGRHTVTVIVERGAGH